MGCCTPDYVNGWIITALSKGTTTSSDNDSKQGGDDNGGGSGDNDDDTKGYNFGSTLDEIGEENDNDNDDNNDDDEDQIGEEDSIDDEVEYEDEIITNVDSIETSVPFGESEDYCVPLESEDLSVPLDHDHHDHDHDQSNHADEILSLAPSGEISMGLNDEIIALLSMSIIEIGAYVDFEDARLAKENGEEFEIQWNDKGCKEVVRNLVLVIEAILIHGLLPKRRHRQHQLSEETSDGEEYLTFTDLLMDATRDLESLEIRCKSECFGETDANDSYEDEKKDINLVPKPNMNELATLRTLIAAWLHTGLVHRTLSVLLQSGRSLFEPFYHEEAFILNRDCVWQFLRLLESLDRVDILVDASTVLSCAALDLYQVDKSADAHQSIFPPSSPDNSTTETHNNNASLNNSPTKKTTSYRITKGLQHKTRIPKLGRSIKANFESNKKRISNLTSFENNKKRISNLVVRVGVNSGDGFVRRNSSPSGVMSSLSYGNQEPPHLNFRKNSVFSSSLRTERESRMKSFATVFNAKRPSMEMICRSRIVSKTHFSEHKELHNLAKNFYLNTSVLGVRNVPEPRVTDTAVNNDKTTGEIMLTIDTISPRRKFHIPEDDSSFLLRVAPSPLDVVKIHRDQRSNSLSYKKFVGYYDEQILHADTKTDRGARLRKKCFLRYYPNDRTASLSFIQSDRDLRGKDLTKIPVLLRVSDVSNRPKEFERSPCIKGVRKGSERATGALANSILASTLMDSADFSNVPRSGKAADFIYRLSLYEEPAIDLSGKRIIIQDASTLGFHQADASSLEISDASLSIALNLDINCVDQADNMFCVKCAQDGAPLVFMKVVETSVLGSPSSQGIKPELILKPFKISYVRAALLVASSRKEAQRQCLISHARSGSAKKATKTQMDALLQIPLFLLEYATSKSREKQSVLLRDLKLGINHVDRDQLRRNGIWNPRYPTKLKQLKVKVEDVIEVKSSNSNDLLSQSTMLYKLKCIAVTEYIGVNDDDCNDQKPDGTNLQYGDLCREEWVVWRPFRDFATLHKVLKSIVNPSESSAGAGAKLVGAATGLATAALTIGNSHSSNQSSTKRKALVPSLNQAAKAGGLSRKTIAEKRKHILNGYLIHLLAHNNLLNRCPELLRFLGAYDPLPAEVMLGKGILTDVTDALGRSEMGKTFLQNGTLSQVNTNNLGELLPPPITMNLSENPVRSKKKEKRIRKEQEKQQDPIENEMLESIRNRIERVKLSQVRASIFGLIRCTFDLDNASFFRNRVVDALKTMSYALTSNHGFKKTLLSFHTKYLTGKSLAYWIKYVRDEKVWPGGVIFTSAPELNLEEKGKLRMSSSELMHKSFPDQLSALLGQENTLLGIDMLHEMIQNRVVLKSICYMMLDAVAVEIFPEIGDVVTCSQALDTSVE